MGKASQADEKAIDERMRAVIADDDPFARRVIKDVLERAGVIVVAEARHGRQAVDLTLHYQPDVVVTVVGPSVRPTQVRRGAFRRQVRSGAGIREKGWKMRTSPRRAWTPRTRRIAGVSALLERFRSTTENRGVHGGNRSRHPDSSGVARTGGPCAWLSGPRDCRVQPPSWTLSARGRCPTPKKTVSHACSERSDRGQGRSRARVPEPQRSSSGPRPSWRGSSSVLRGRPRAPRRCSRSHRIVRGVCTFIPFTPSDPRLRSADAQRQDWDAFSTGFLAVALTRPASVPSTQCGRARPSTRWRSGHATVLCAGVVTSWQPVSAASFDVHPEPPSPPRWCARAVPRVATSRRIPYCAHTARGGERRRKSTADD
jgi:hypothetical protein